MVMCIAEKIFTLTSLTCEFQTVICAKISVTCEMTYRLEIEGRTNALK